jgi:hypothetical protein
VKGYKNGHLPSLEKTIFELKEKAGFYIDDKFKRAIFKNV